jgi:hypothetical protein
MIPGFGRDVSCFYFPMSPCLKPGSAPHISGTATWPIPGHLWKSCGRTVFVPSLKQKCLYHLNICEI